MQTNYDFEWPVQQKVACTQEVSGEEREGVVWCLCWWCEILHSKHKPNPTYCKKVLLSQKQTEIILSETELI